MPSESPSIWVSRLPVDMIRCVRRAAKGTKVRISAKLVVCEKLGRGKRRGWLFPVCFGDEVIELWRLSRIFPFVQLIEDSDRGI
jgi:hypothetical protein